jgi:hypothetical protein
MLATCLHFRLKVDSLIGISDHASEQVQFMQHCTGSVRSSLVFEDLNDIDQNTEK